MKIIPARIGPMLQHVTVVADRLATHALNRLDGMSSINDAGNAGSNKVTYKLITGYDHVEDCILEMFVGADVIHGGGGEAIALSILADAVRLDLTPPFIGQAADNAGDVSKTCVRRMQASQTNYVCA